MWTEQIPANAQNVQVTHSGVYILENPPRGGEISADIIWGKKYEKGKRKRGKCKRKWKKGERKGRKVKENEERGSKRVK
jgi:hypothetical protein